MPDRLKVKEIKNDGAAQSADILVGDIILKYDGYVINSEHDLNVAIAQRQGNDTKVNIQLFRNGNPIEVECRAGDLGITVITDESKESHYIQTVEKSLLVNVLILFAWISLFSGLVSAIVVNFYISGYAGLLVGAAIFIQSILIFVLLKVIAVIACDVRFLKNIISTKN